MTREKLDRTIFELIRKEVVRSGYLPDITAYNTIAAYTDAKTALRQTLPEKVLTEVFGVGTFQAKGEIKPNMIVIGLKRKTNGSLGGFPAIGYEPYVEVVGGENVTKYNKLQYPDKSEDVTYEIRIITSTVKWERLLDELLYRALGTRTVFNSIKEDHTLSGEEFLLMKTNEVDTSSVDFKEIMYEYTAVDVWLQPFKTLATGIPSITDFEQNILPTDTDSI